MLKKGLAILVLSIILLITIYIDYIFNIFIDSLTKSFTDNNIFLKMFLAELLRSIPAFIGVFLMWFSWKKINQK